MNSHIVGGEVTSAAHYVPTLTNPVRRKIYSGPHSVTRALGASYQPQLNPSMVIRVHVAKQYRHAVHIVDNHVDLTVVEDVAKCGSTAHGDRGKPRSLHWG